MTIEKMKEDLKNLEDGLKNVEANITQLTKNSLATQGAIMYLKGTIADAEKALKAEEPTVVPTGVEKDNIVDFPAKE